MDPAGRHLDCGHRLLSRSSAVDYAAADVWSRLAAAVERWPVRLADDFGWVHCEPGWSWRRQLTDFDLWSVAAGSGEAWLDQRHVRLRPGVTLLLRPGDRIDARHRPDDPLIVGYVHYEHADRTPSAAPIPAALLPPRVVQLDDLATVHEPLRSAAHRGHRVGTGRRGAAHAATRLHGEAALAAILLEVHLQAARRAGALPPPIDRRLQLVVDLVRAQPARRWTLSQVADRAQLSPAHFSRLFREQTGESFRAFCVSARMDRARTLLGETGVSVAAAARMLGYTDYRLFARQFARRHAQSPTRWRASRH